MKIDYLPLLLFVLFSFSCQKDEMAVGSNCNEISENNKLQSFWTAPLTNSGASSLTEWTSKKLPLQYGGDILININRQNYPSNLFLLDGETGRGIAKVEMDEKMNEGIGIWQDELIFVAENELKSLNISSYSSKTIVTIPGSTNHYLQLFKNFAVLTLYDPTGQPSIEDKIVIVDLRTSQATEVYQSQRTIGVYEPFLLDPVLWENSNGLFVTFLKTVDYSYSTLEYDYELVTIDFTTLEIIHSIPIAEKNKFISDEGNLVLHNGKAVLSMEEFIYCFDPITGEKFWAVENYSDGLFGYASMLFFDNKIFKYDEYCDCVFAIDATNGATVWESESIGEDESVRKVDWAYDKGVVYFVLDDIYALDVSSGQFLWKGASVEDGYIDKGIIFNPVHGSLLVKSFEKIYSLKPACQ